MTIPRPLLSTAALLALSSLALAGCTHETPTAAVGTVQLAIIADAEHGGRPFSAELTQEVTTQPVWAGDPDGVGAALITVNAGAGQVCWEISVADIQLPATASHIHRAAPGVRGGIVVALSPPNQDGVSHGCSLGHQTTLLREILLTPEAFYVNVHTGEFPAGAIRGQLAR